METSDKEFYEKLSGRELSNQEIFETRSGFVGFFDLLYRIDKRNEKRKESETVKNKPKK